MQQEEKMEKKKLCKRLVAVPILEKTGLTGTMGLWIYEL